MRSNYLKRVIVGLALPVLGMSQVLAQQSATELDFDFFKNEVQPILLAKRDGKVRCIQCHTRSSGFRLQPLTEDAYFWTDEQSQLNFESAKAFTAPGKPPLQSRFLTHPLATAAGGDPFHGGGKHFDDQRDPEWRIMADWVAGATQRREARDTVVRIIQTNAAGDNSHIIDPVTNTVVGVIENVEIPHGVASAPDGSQIYLSNEALHTLDVIDSRTLRVKRRIPLSDRPNNIAVSKDGRRVYVAIMEAPGAVDVVDVLAMRKIKTIPASGQIHNVYVTPDGKYAVGGSVHTSTIDVIDTASNEIAWTMKMSAGIRPMAFDTHSDGSTQHIYLQLSHFHGFAVVDFNSRKEVARVEHPPIPGVEAHYDGLQLAPTHGLGIPPKGKQTLWSLSKIYGYAYIHSLPDLEEIGRVHVGQHPEWITFTPDGRYAYIGVAGDNATVVVDVQNREVLARIPVGQTPKRIGTVSMQVD